MKVSVIIPCHRPHMACLPNSIDSIECGSVLPDEIIIALSGVSRRASRRLRKSLRHHANVHVLATHERQSAVQNRNRGGAIATGDILVFFDADDVCHPQKIEVTKILFEKYGPNMLVHDFVWNSREDFKTYRIDEIPLVMPEQLLRLTFGDPPRRDPSSETGILGDTNLNAGESFTIHHGHVAVTKQTFDLAEYSERFNFRPGEDGFYCRDVLFRFRNTIYANAKLIDYHDPDDEPGKRSFKRFRLVKYIVPKPIRKMGRRFLELF